ncbi:MAG: flagellar hook-length control protein FliK [Lachnospiraceae bacterium]|nr:flagellar hook-length control protein FliK [Lachnospiraceae bacterium]
MQLSDILKAFTGQNNISISGGENISVSNPQLIKQFIQALTPGQIISGEVKDVTGDLLKLLVTQDSGQLMVSAKLDQNIALPTGKNILFQVKNTGSTLSLSPLYENMAMEKTGAMALEQAGIPVTEATLALTGTLMKEGMPIDKESLTNMYQQVTQYGQEQLSNLVDLQKLQLPISPENLEQMGNYKNMTHQLLQGLEQFSTELPKVLEGLVAEGKETIAGQVLKAVLEPLVVPSPEEAVETFKAQPEQKETILLREDAPIMGKENSLPTELSKATDGKALLQEVVKLLQRGEDVPIKELVRDERFAEAIKEFQKQELMLSPEETTKEKIKELYSKLGKQLQVVSEALDKSTLLETNLGKNVTQMNQNVNFLNQMNQMYAYIQLPLKMSGNDAHGELYVYSNKKRLSSENGEVSALLHLDMDSLGPVDVYVAMQYEKVSTQFYLKDEEMLDFINDHMNILTDRLKARGYDMSVTTSVRSTTVEENTCMKELLSTHSNIPLLATESFDVRA